MQQNRTQGKNLNVTQNVTQQINICLSFLYRNGDVRVVTARRNYTIDKLRKIIYVKFARIPTTGDDESLYFKPEDVSIDDFGSTIGENVVPKGRERGSIVFNIANIGEE